MKPIKKISKKNVEEFLGVRLIPNLISIGADTASYHTAFAIIRTTPSYVIFEGFEKIEVPKLGKTSTLQRVLSNVDLFTEQLDELKHKWSQKYKFDYIQIEDCFYQFSVKTTKLLAYNGILTYDRLKRISNTSVLMMPGSARAKINFKKSKKKVSGSQLKKEIILYINNALGLELKLKENDVADAIVLALAGLVE